MIWSDGYTSYRAYLKKPNELTIEKEKAMSMVNCMDHTLIPRTLYEELAKGFRDGFMKGLNGKEKENMNKQIELNIDGVKHFAERVEIEHEPDGYARINVEGCKFALKENGISFKFLTFCPSCVHSKYSNKDVCHGCKMTYFHGINDVALPNNYIPVKEIKKEKENMNTKIEKPTLTDEDFRNNVTVKFGGKTCEIEQVNIAYEWHGTNDIGFRIIGKIPKHKSYNDMLNEAIDKMKKDIQTYNKLCDPTFNIKDVIFNPPATIVFWEDGTKTVVKASNEDFDPEKGLAMAVTKKLFGNKYEYFNQVKKWTKKYYKAHPAGDA